MADKHVIDWPHLNSESPGAEVGHSPEDSQKAGKPRRSADKPVIADQPIKLKRGLVDQFNTVWMKNEARCSRSPFSSEFVR